MEKKEKEQENSLYRHVANLRTTIYKVIKYNTSDGTR